MCFTGVHCVWPKLGWLLSYGLKGVSTAMVARLVRFLQSCYGGIINLREGLCCLVPINPTDKKRQAVQMNQLWIILQGSKVETRSAIVATQTGTNFCRIFQKNVNDRHTILFEYEYVFPVILVSSIYYFSNTCLNMKLKLAMDWDIWSISVHMQIVFT